MTEVIKTSAFFDEWNKDEWEQYLGNLYEKVYRDLPLDPSEQEALRSSPEPIVKEVDQQSQQKEPKEPEVIRVKRVKHRDPEVAPLTDDEIQKVINQSPEGTVLNAFYPELFKESDFFVDVHKNPIPGSYIDASLNTLLYLKDLGFKTATWHLGPEHKSYDKIPSRNQMKDNCKPTPETNGVPICDFLNTRMFSVEELIAKSIDHADQKGYRPYKPVIAQSHPGCKCYLVCWQPNSPEEIPDDAPGVPTFGDQEEQLHYKTQIFNRIGSTPTTVDRWTVLSKEVYQATKNTRGKVVDEWDIRRIIQSPTGKNIRYKRKIPYEAGFYNEWIKTASEMWDESIKPVAITTSYIYRSLLGPIRPIPATYIGFQTHIADDYSVIYLADMARSIIAPSSYIQELQLKENPSLDIDAKTFVRVGDSLGIVIKVLDNKKIVCYIPEFGSTVVSDAATSLEVI